VWFTCSRFDFQWLTDLVSDHVASRLVNIVLVVHLIIDLFVRNIIGTLGAEFGGTYELTSTIITYAPNWSAIIRVSVQAVVCRIAH
jgi:hypothetical protein